MNILLESKMIIIYLLSKPKKWTIRRTDIMRTLDIGQNRFNNAWRELKSLNIIIKNKIFGKCDFALNVNAIYDNVKCENDKCVNDKHVLEPYSNTGDISNTILDNNTDNIIILDKLEKSDHIVIYDDDEDWMKEIKSYTLNK